MAGILDSMFGGDPKQYVQSGYELTQALIRELSLPGWTNGRPSHSPTNERYLDEMLEGFKEGSSEYARSKGSETVLYHPEYWAYIERFLTDCALRLEAVENADSEPWTVTVSTYLKAWASGLNPWAMLGVAALLFEQGQARFAKRTLAVCSLFPRYWNSRPTQEVEYTLLGYTTIRVYVYKYSGSDLKDAGETRCIEKLSKDIETVKQKYG